MKKLLTFLTLLTLSIGVSWATEVTIIMSEQGWSNAQDISSVTSGDVSIVFAKEDGQNGPKYYDTGEGARLYAKNTMTVTANGNTINSIVLTFSGTSYLGSLSTNVGNYSVSNTTGTWSGSSTFVTFTAGVSHARIQKVVVTYTGGTPEPDPTTPSGTITFNPAAGSVSSGTEIEITFSGTCDGIKYTTDGTTSPDENNGDEYDPANPPTITEATTIIAAAYNYSNSQYAFGTEASASYTISSGGGSTETATYIFNTTEGLQALGINPNENVDIAGNTYTVGNISFVATDGTTPTRIFHPSGGGVELRVYTDATFTISATSGKITRIDFTSEDGSNAANSDNLSVDKGTMSTNFWTGSASKVVFTASHQVRIRTIKVYYTPSETPPSSVEYYLAGDFSGDGWPATTPYMFTPKGNGIYVLEKELPDMANTDYIRFKIVKAETGKDNVYYGANRSGDDYGINWTNRNETFALSDANNAAAFSLLDCYNAIFTLNTNDMTFTVEKPQFFLRESDNGSDWTNYEMTVVENNGGWTITKTVDAPKLFHFYNAWHEHRGSSETNDESYHIYPLDQNRSLVASGKNFYMLGAGQYTMTVNYNTDNLNIVAPKYKATIANTNGGSLSFNESSQQTSLNMYYDETVNVYVTPNDNYQLNTLTYTVEGTTNAVPITMTDGVYSFKMPIGNVTINATFTYNGPVATTKTFALIKSTDDLIVGEKYLIVNEAAGKALQFNGTASTASDIDISNNETTISETDAAILTLGISDGEYTFATGTGYVANTSSTNIVLGSSDTWTVTFNGDNAVIHHTLGTTDRYVRYLSNNFKAYASNNSYNGSDPVQLYKEVAATLKAPVISPEGGTFLTSETPSVTVSITCATADATIYYSTDGENFSEYTEPLTVTSTTTVYAYSSKGEENSETVTESYNFTDVLIDPVVFSPIAGTYSGAQTLEMYSVNQNAKIYYTTDGSTPSATNGTLYSSSDVINLAVSNTYNFKAIAVLGNNCSAITEGTYTINAASSSTLNSIAELNSADTDEEATLGNPFQIIYMNTWRNDGHTPEYAYVRDNSGYGLIYFRNDYYHYTSNGVVHDNPNAVQNALICEMGDWIPGNAVTGTVKVWSDGFHNELGGSSYRETITDWPTSRQELKGNTPIIPEEMTNANINAGWDISNTFADAFNAAFQQYCTNNNLDPNNLTDQQKNLANAYAIEQVGGYSSHIQPDNVWGHYVHLRKNTIEVTNGTNNPNATPDGEGDLKRHKYSGFVTDQSGEKTIYYDGFYLFSGYNGTEDLSDEYFEEIQNAGATFDVYGIVGFYGPYAADAEHNYIPFEIIPIDFKYIYKPIIHMDGVDYNNPSTVTKYEQQTITLTCATEGATIWYKTSDMEDFVEYTEPITVDATTTIETYSTISVPEYNDMMESVVNSLEINMGSIEKPVISPESIVKTVGDDPVNATITCETSDATIYFTVDGSDPKDDTNENRYEYTAANIAEYLTGIDETTTVRAIAFKDNFYSAEADAKTYTFVKSNGIIYDLVTDQTQLNESSVFVIVNKANNMAVGTTQNEYNRSGDGVKFVDENTKTQVYGNDELAQFTLKKVGNNWFLQTTNSNVNGYLYVGDGNTLLTSATATDAAEATINIDADSEHQAHISFVYNYETTRYLRYWNGGQAFSTYTSETSNLPVSLYYVKATPLANIEKEGEVGEQYTVADQLIAVDYREYGENDVYLWCKDQGNVSIAKTSINEDNQVDFMKQQGAQEGDWDQSNWVILKLTGQTGLSKAIAATRDGEKIQPHYIAPATITGHYVNDQNYMIEVTDNEFTVGEAVTYTPNVYCTANFVPENLNIWGTDEDGAYTGDATINTQNYFFMNPKVEEFCTITWAKWDGSKFVVPSTSGFEGSFNIDLTFNEDKEVIDDLNNANANAEEGVEILYQFNAIIQHNTNGSGSSKAASSDIIVYPMDLTASSAIDPATAINTVETGNGEVKSVKYVNVAGMISDTPFQGVNIVVTEYTDGSRTTTKMLKR